MNNRLAEIKSRSNNLVYDSAPKNTKIQVDKKGRGNQKPDAKHAFYQRTLFEFMIFFKFKVIFNIFSTHLSRVLSKFIEDWIVCSCERSLAVLRGMIVTVSIVENKVYSIFFSRPV